MRSLLALASVLHAKPAPVLAALADVLAVDGAYERRGSGLERLLPVFGVEQWRVFAVEEGSRLECELASGAASSALAGVFLRRRIRAAPERFRAVVTAVADAVE
ncbi:hypothetical protein C5C31_05705 [Rathayibacter rathayi]|uniref:Uncharacterized protein n=1 Tax=Rathayibacter rathayi TaxID=33887 RepID=A0ABD6WCG2_RATRA|nr:hypothetical protein [Rathayibacter rathayi]MWV74250.1 hypothetical protein [Rathayibacter rathayi NCPPB 2980 = VKM Ac-1601]PPF16002.1 hypothetical protein C5C04_01995 [Rathayibacter rathayi]PPF22777.1 hypothetical protein C5C34_11120 [Rathayibacter rathayi]PPF49340.1 hypothetical protein C5C08_07595 [Rathayibacter rathayi]PPF81858.1 hypothetical protein C5C14_04445 [Rathayibacter rathayi]